MLANRDARSVCSHWLTGVSRTEESPGWVFRTRTDDASEHHMHCGDTILTRIHRSHTMARPAGHALCMILPSSPAVDTRGSAVRVHGGARTWSYLAFEAPAAHTAHPCVPPSNKRRHPMPSRLRHVPSQADGTRNERFVTEMVAPLHVNRILLTLACV